MSFYSPSLTSNTDIGFTSYTSRFHETGVYDLPAFIDFILNKTEHKKIAYSGLSLGASFFYVLCSEKPEYQDKLYGAILFQPLGEGAQLDEMTLGARLATNTFDVQMVLIKFRFQINEKIDWKDWKK